jgi:hypothetical protein
MVNERAPLVRLTALNAGLAVGTPPRRVARRLVGGGILVLFVAFAHAFTPSARRLRRPSAGNSYPPRYARRLRASCERRAVRDRIRQSGGFGHAILMGRVP